MSRAVFFGALFVWMLTIAIPVNGHDGRPVFLELSQSGAGEFDLSWRIPPVLEPGELPLIRLEGDCRTQDYRPPALTGKQRYQCGGELSQLALILEFPRGNPSLSSVTRVVMASGDVRFIHAGPSIKQIRLDLPDDSKNLFVRYAGTGMSHILGGYDHLLFVLCVIWLAFSWRRIFLAITGFTLAHSLTLGLSAMDVISIAVVPTEILIALSIMFVAAELVRENRQTLSWRYPVIVSAFFGLLHGLGFASAIREIGLPAEDALLALLAFNVGVEAGQLLFVVVLIGSALLLNRLSGDRMVSRVNEFRAGSGYIVGGFAAFWFIERLVGAF